MKAYNVIMTTQYCDHTEVDEFLYAWPDAAESHKRHIEKLQLGGDSVEIAEVEIASLPQQKIEIKGDDVGYQFSRSTMGKRTITRTIRNIRRDNGHLVGELDFKGRHLIVRQSNRFFSWKVERV